MKKHRFILMIALLSSLSIQPVLAGNVCVVQSSETVNCREFDSKVSFDNSYPQQDGGKGVACLQSDGLWKVVSGPGFGTSFQRSDNQVNAYIGGSIYLNGQYLQQPTKIRYLVSSTSVCVPRMPVFHPTLTTVPAAPVPVVTPAVTP